MLAAYELQYVQNLKYLGVQFLAAKKLKCSVDNTRLKFYRTFHAIYSRRTDRQTDRQTDSLSWAHGKYWTALNWTSGEDICQTSEGFSSISTVYKSVNGGGR